MKFLQVFKIRNHPLVTDSGDNIQIIVIQNQSLGAIDFVTGFAMDLLDSVVR